MNALLLYASCSITVILLAVSPSVFSWSKLGHGSSLAAFLLPRPEKGAFLPNSLWTPPARVAVVGLEATDLVSIWMNAATGRATWRYLSCSPRCDLQDVIVQQNRLSCGSHSLFSGQPNPVFFKIFTAAEPFENVCVAHGNLCNDLSVYIA